MSHTGLEPATFGLLSQRTTYCANETLCTFCSLTKGIIFIVIICIFKPATINLLSLFTPQYLFRDILKKLGVPSFYRCFSRFFKVLNIKEKYGTPPKDSATKVKRKATQQYSQYCEVNI